MATFSLFPSKTCERIFVSETNPHSDKANGDIETRESEWTGSGPDVDFLLWKPRWHQPSPMQCCWSLRIDIRCGRGAQPFAAVGCTDMSATTPDVLRKSFSFFKYPPEVQNVAGQRRMAFRTEERNGEEQLSTKFENTRAPIGVASLALCRRCNATLTHMDSCPGGHCQRLKTTPTLGFSMSVRTISVAVFASHTRLSFFFSPQASLFSESNLTSRLSRHGCFLLFWKKLHLNAFFLAPPGDVTKNDCVSASLFFFFRCNQDVQC